MNARWTLRHLVDAESEPEIGRIVVELATQLGVRVRPDVYDGSGFCGSLGVWRVAGRVWGVVEAGSG